MEQKPEIEKENKFEIKWQAPEFFYYQKDVSWYWLVLILGVILVAFALWQKNFLFAVFVVIAMFLLFYWGRSEPRSVEFKLNEKGLEIDKKFHPYEDFVYFSVNENSEINSLNQLNLKTKNRLRSLISIYVEKEKMGVVKKKLSRYLEEIKYEENLIDVFLKLFRF